MNDKREETRPYFTFIPEPVEHESKPGGIKYLTTRPLVNVPVDPFTQDYISGLLKVEPKRSIWSRIMRYIKGVK